MAAFEHALILLLLIASLSVLARWLPWPPLITYLLGGVGAALVPQFPRLELDPGFFFLCFLPPLLFADGWLMPLREFVRARRAILTLAIGLVLFTTVTVGLVAWWLVPGLPLAMALALGAIVSPTDAVAVNAITERLRVPARLTTVLNGESLMNDATGLVGFKFALAAVVAGSFSLGRMAADFSLLAVGGFATGLVISYGIGRLRDLLQGWHAEEPHLAITISLLTPFAAYLAAEHLGVSGVLAVVAAGLYAGWRDPVRTDVETRQSTFAVWRLLLFWLNGIAFALLGPGQPNTFYIGVNNGGVWKTTDAGRVWTPIFDDQPTGSIGAIAVAPSNPDIIYVGSGEGLQRPDLSVGDGIYKSTDAGRSWQHLGLRDGQQIAQIAVDPRDPNRVFAAVLGHPYGANAERGVYRSLDGGATWQQVLFKDENTGAFDVVFDPSNARHVYAVLWSARQAPWEAGWTLSANGGLYHSTDGGTTWQPVGSGLPGAADGLGRIGLGVSPSEPSRMYAVVGATRGGGLYRSDDAGATWRVVNTDNRIWGRDGDFNEVKVDSRDADVLYVANVASWKSTDGGAHFRGFRGAPGGDDYHRFWISPDDSRVILLSSDQGAVVTVNGGETWSSWYNQPTAQFYHVITDNAFPYRIYGGQQESGSAGVLSRGDDGQITFREWHPVGAEEYGYIAPDPLHPNLVYGGKITRFDWNTGEVKNVAPAATRSGAYRFVRTAPIIFSPVDPHVLYYAGNVLFRTVNGGESWSVISPDLTREHYEVPASLGVFAALDPEHGTHRGVIYTIAPSFRRVNLIWVGTDDGLIHVTHDGGRHWRDVTPPQLTPYSKVSLMVASHFDTLVAYAAVNRFRLDDMRPHLYRTRDGGATWDEIVSGIPDNEVVNAVREDPSRPGLLFAGSERAVYLSLDDGDHWQSLRLDMPATSIRDIWIHDNDLVAGTHGRGFWVLDDFARLRQVAADGQDARASRLFRPSAATRVRWNRNTDTPLPFDEPHAENPPDGAIIDYVVGEGREAGGERVLLEVLDRAGNLVRKWASDDSPEPVDSGANIPLWWVRPEQRLLPSPGAHRFVWDLHEPPPPVSNHDYPISAAYRNTPREPRGPWVMPGRYTVRLTVGGRTFIESLTVRMDPRVHATPLALRAQFQASRRLVEAMRRDSAGLRDLADLRPRLAAPQTDSLAAVQRELGRIEGQLAGLLGIVDGADQAPTTQAMHAIGVLETSLTAALTRAAALGH